ncbi:hypothetical protein Taro_003255 [Colocasia esculenta]|uniref:Aminotransferase-like plant mobile domain-containing protein n=1 Tax=Colocasia esculenta TaxID=4460 RepID=A0A843TLK3_COLES|nr:hypothetical protein [Colocasia esculenta]
MKRNYPAFQEEIPPYSGPKAARESYVDLQHLSDIPGHIFMRPDLQILPSQRQFSKIPWLSPMLELLPPASISHLKEWGLSTVLVLAKKYDKMVHVWDSVTALAERWHPQTHTFIFPTFEATVLLEELEIMIGLPQYHRGEEFSIFYTVAPINSWSILAEITTRKTDLHSMTSRMHVHLLPIAQWINSQCKRKTGNYQVNAKAAAICICGVILFPMTDGAISFANLSIVDSISEGMSIGQAVLGFLYADLSSVAMGGPFFGSMVTLELWMGVHIQFRAMEELATECKTMLNHLLAFVGGPLRMSTKAWCKTAQLKGWKAWRDYFKRMTVAEFDMRPRFMHGRMIHLPQRTGLTLRLLGNEALVIYNPNRCYLQCGAARTVVPIVSHYPPTQERKRGDEQDECDVRRAIVYWEGCARSVVQTEVEEDDDVIKEYIEALKKIQPVAGIMEGEKNLGEGSSWRKCQAERRSSRCQAEAPPVEEEVDTAEIDVEEEEEAPTMNVEEEWKKCAKAMKSGEMRVRVSWTLVLAVFLAFPHFQRDRIAEMGFGEIFRIERMRVDSALTQALRSRWDAEATAFVFPWGHMIPSLEDVSRITGLRVYGKPVSGFTYPCYYDLAERLLELPVERRSSLVPRVALQASLGLHEAGKSAGESKDEYLERLVRISRRELVSEPGAEADMDLCYFLVLFLGRLLFATRGDEDHCRFSPLLEDLSEVWAYLHLPALGRGDLTRLGLVPIARRWDSRRDSRNLGDQLERLQEAIDSYPYLDVIWQPYLGEGDEGQPWLVQARPYFGRSVWLHALNLVLPLYLHLSQRSLGLRQTVVEFPVDVTGEIASLRALLYSAVQDWEAAQRQAAELRRELERAQLVGAVLRAEEAQRHLEERERDLQLTMEHAMDLQGQRDQLQGEVRATQSSSSRRRNEEEERRRQGEGSAQSGRGGGEMPPPPDPRRDLGRVAVDTEET